MDKKEILDFITKNPIAYVATVEGKKPHVRAFGTYRADENGIVFSMQSNKDVYKQVTKNPEVELCYYANSVQIRVAGKFSAVEDMALKKEMVEKRTFLKPQVEQHGWDFLKVFVMKGGKATVLDMKTPTPPGAPQTWVNL
jgi:uncharacterized pyridoxamine 5'-phosphate oxidase family protein